MLVLSGPGYRPDSRDLGRRVKVDDDFLRDEATFAFRRDAEYVGNLVGREIRERTCGYLRICRADEHDDRVVNDVDTAVAGSSHEVEAARHVVNRLGDRATDLLELLGLEEDKRRAYQVGILGIGFRGLDSLDLDVITELDRTKTDLPAVVKILRTRL